MSHVPFKSMYLLTAIILVLPVTIGLHKVWHVVDYFSEDGFDRLLRPNAALNAIDCGTSSGDNPSSDRDRVDACTVDSFRSRRPFFARFDFAREIHGYHAVGLVSNGRNDFQQWGCFLIPRSKKERILSIPVIYRVRQSPLCETT